MQTPIYIGIDVSKDKFDYAAMDTHNTIIKKGSLQMNRDGFIEDSLLGQEISQLIESFPNVVVGFESTGTYHVNIMSFLLSLTEHVYLLNPALVKKFAEADSLRKTKTDAVDAIAIARFLIYRQHSIFAMTEIDSAYLTQLARLRESITRDVGKTKTHLKQMLNIAFPELLKHANVFTDTFLQILEQFPSAKAIRKATKKRIQKIFYNPTKSRGKKPDMNPDQLFDLAKYSIGTADESLEMAIKFDIKHLVFLQKHLDEVTSKLIDNVNKRFGNELEILKSIKGIGDTTACHFLSEVKNIQRFSNYKQLIAYAGTDPSVKQSGKMIKRGKISKRGVSSLRRVGYLITCSVIRHDGVFRDYYIRKREEGMAYRKAVIATWNKLLRVIFAILTKQVKFVPNHG
ncbi:MAG: IS110 family transposase [Deltaproteobacteria bacterium]|nr:IS110 family transposase [Deltaproteobacteria bacterium]MBL7135857.1 IS110 family transposase [Candidatus Neomarinimicrobiota bacterium]